VVDANILASTCALPIAKQRVFNIGTGKSISIKELADMITDDQAHLRRRPGEVQNTQALNAKARTVIGKDKYVDLREWLKEELEKQNES
jgi:nucleoside-diphosphate-sugar epimerase